MVKATTLAIVGVLAALGAVIGSYFMFRKRDTRAHDKDVVVDSVKRGWNVTNRYVNELFATSKPETPTIH